MKRREITSREIVESSVKAIEAEDSTYNSIACLNPNAYEIAERLDIERAQGQVRSSLHGIPILLKDNIDTEDQMITSAGSLALQASLALKDSHLVSRLRRAGAVILGKTNLSEWANFRSTRSSSGWSSRGGQVRNAYAIDRTPGGSSSGSAVAVARGFCPLAVGTETDGSIVGPSSMNSIVGIKPTVGLVSRTGIIPISHSQDTAGPMARTISDSVVLLSVISGHDPEDNKTTGMDDHLLSNLFSNLNLDALKSARIGVVRNYAGFHESVDHIFDLSLKTLSEAGAIVIDEVNLVPAEEIRPYERIVMLTEFKVGLNAYLSKLSPDVPVRSLAKLIEFNETNADVVMPYFQQEQLVDAEMTKGLNDPIYINALANCRRLTREEGIDRAVDQHSLTALVAPTSPAPWAIDWINGDNRLGGSSILAAVAGYASITVPMGYVSGLPVGISFIGKAWSEAKLLGIAFSFEQMSLVRMKPGKPGRLLP